MKDYIKVISFSCLLFLAFLGFIDWRKDGFYLSKISSNKEVLCEKQNLTLSTEEKQELEKILDQKFSYLGKGRQCFVFSSEDGLYVIKFFNKNHYLFPKWLKSLSLPKPLEVWKERKMKNKKKRKKTTFYSYQIAIGELKEQTGLIYVHFQKEPIFSHLLEIQDKTNKSFSLNLNSLEFVIQKKAKLLTEEIKKFQNQKKTVEVQVLLDKFLENVYQRCEKNVVDQDMDAPINYGVEGSRVIVFDAGRFCKDLELSFPYEMRKSIESFRSWLEKNAKEHVIFFDKRAEAYFNKLNMLNKLNKLRLSKGVIIPFDPSEGIELLRERGIEGSELKGSDSSTGSGSTEKNASEEKEQEDSFCKKI
jgi:hypothetical protein